VRFVRNSLMWTSSPGAKIYCSTSFVRRKHFLSTCMWSYISLNRPLLALSLRQNSNLCSLFSSVNIGFTTLEWDSKIFSILMRQWMVPLEIARAPSRSWMVLLCLKGISKKQLAQCHNNYT
jgi:hypothetical protein